MRTIAAAEHQFKATGAPRSSIYLLYLVFSQQLQSRPGDPLATTGQKAAQLSANGQNRRDAGGILTHCSANPTAPQWHNFLGMVTQSWFLTDGPGQAFRRRAIVDQFAGVPGSTICRHEPAGRRTCRITHIDNRGSGQLMSSNKIRNMAEFAEISGLSRPTVSKYFIDPGSVRKSTRLKIEQALRKYDYRPNLFAVNLNKKTSNIIGVIVPDTTDAFYSNL
eukprot:gene28487-31786_t